MHSMNRRTMAETAETSEASELQRDGLTMQACSSRSSRAQQASPEGSLQSFATRCAPMCARSYMDSLSACTPKANLHMHSDTCC